MSSVCPARLHVLPFPDQVTLSCYWVCVCVCVCVHTRGSRAPSFQPSPVRYMPCSFGTGRPTKQARGYGVFCVRRQQHTTAHIPVRSLQRQCCNVYHGTRSPSCFLPSALPDALWSLHLCLAVIIVSGRLVSSKQDLFFCLFPSFNFDNFYTPLAIYIFSFRPLPPGALSGAILLHYPLSKSAWAYTLFFYFYIISSTHQQKW